MEKIRSPRNRTLTLSPEEQTDYANQLIRPSESFREVCIRDRIICGNLFAVADFLPKSCVDLMIIDPPYNLDKNFDGFKFSRTDEKSYQDYIESWLVKLLPALKPTATVYICGDWKCSAAIYEVVQRYLVVRNRITWQRDKGRGARANWKNNTEDIWFATVGNDYYFDADAVRVRKKVIAPYRQNGEPKDWKETEDGKFRMTCASNFWDDITIPYWSMPENTDHPTQKPEKLIAKLILASSAPGDFVFDPFLGSGTTAVTAKKLKRHFSGVELNENYCALALKRLALADVNSAIQGYHDSIFHSRNDKGQS